MKFIALLRGINVGGKHKVEMKRLKMLLESLGCLNVSTYINSGNVLFESSESQENLQEQVAAVLQETFGFDIPTLIKTKQELQAIAAAIPEEWQNDSEQKTDVAYLFEQINSEKTIDIMPLKREFIDIRYVQGAMIWNIKREHVNKSQLNKLVGHKLYKLMTIRNVNTARYLAEG